MCGTLQFPFQTRPLKKMQKFGSFSIIALLCTLLYEDRFKNSEKDNFSLKADIGSTEAGSVITSRQPAENACSRAW